MALAFGRLGLTPVVFWAMTPGEFTALLEGRGLLAPAHGGLSREELEALAGLLGESASGSC
ncbi:phage tail assembly chaperone [Fodinicurvata sediminis]|uniref:phage tail assembly chaperone n=1 Tax=Fodinicurvata sediminis TaxID=1121832 RepID=UPI0003B6A990|nr:phage tail assembly chaperone [Fodinicurvata sediminis]